MIGNTVSLRRDLSELEAPDQGLQATLTQGSNRDRPLRQPALRCFVIYHFLSPIHHSTRDPRRCSVASTKPAGEGSAETSIAIEMDLAGWRLHPGDSAPSVNKHSDLEKLVCALDLVVFFLVIPDIDVDVLPSLFQVYEILEMNRVSEGEAQGEQPDAFELRSHSDILFEGNAAPKRVLFVR